MYELRFTPSYTGLFQIEIAKALPGILAEYYYGAAVHNNTPTMADVRRIENFQSERFSLEWDIEDAPAFLRFSGLLHFEKCRLERFMKKVPNSATMGPPAIAFWVTQNSTVEILFWNDGDVATKGKERVPQMTEFVRKGDERRESKLDQLDLSLLKNSNTANPCIPQDIDNILGFYCLKLGGRSGGPKKSCYYNRYVISISNKCNNTKTYRKFK